MQITTATPDSARPAHTSCCGVHRNSMVSEPPMRLGCTSQPLA